MLCFSVVSFSPLTINVFIKSISIHELEYTAIAGATNCCRTSRPSLKPPMVSMTAEGPRSLIRTGFLHLPYELRRQIYCHCIPRKRQIDVSLPSLPLVHLGDPNGYLEDPEGSLEDPEGSLEDPKDDWYMEHLLNPNFSRLNVLRLSKQISDECLNILYGENIFHVNVNGGGEYSLRNNFTEGNRRRMRYLIIIARPAGVSYETSMPDDSLWATIIPNLKKLLIVAEQPITAGGYWNAPTLEEETGQWLKWIRPYLECFGQHMPETLSATVDDDGRKETRELVQKYLPPGCRLQHSPLGDFIFQRGRFSLESGYWDDDYGGGTGSWDA